MAAVCLLLAGLAGWIWSRTGSPSGAAAKNAGAETDIPLSDASGTRSEAKPRMKIVTDRASERYPNPLGCRIFADHELTIAAQRKLGLSDEQVMRVKRAISMSRKQIATSMAPRLEETAGANESERIWRIRSGGSSYQREMDQLRGEQAGKILLDESMRGFNTFTVGDRDMVLKRRSYASQVSVEFQDPKTGARVGGLGTSLELFRDNYGLDFEDIVKP